MNINTKFFSAVIIPCLVAWFSQSAIAQGTWTTIAPMPSVPGIPVNTATASGVAFGGKFYVIDSGAGYGVPCP